MAHCATRTETCFSKSHRICAEGSQFGLRRAYVDSDRVYGGPMDLEQQDRTWPGDLVRAPWKQMEPYCGGLLVRVREPAGISVHSAALVHEAFHLVSVSLASESHRAEPRTDPSGSLWGVELRGKEFLCIFSHPVRAGHNSRRPCRGTGPVSWRKLAVLQISDCRFHCFLCGRCPCTTVDVQPQDVAGEKE